MFGDFFDSHPENEYLKPRLEKYQQMLANGEPVVFDETEFQLIIEHYFMNYNLSKASECIMHALKLYPESTLLKVWQGRVLMYKQKYTEAMDLCNQIQDQNDIDVILLHGEIIGHSRSFDEADQYLNGKKELFQEDPKDLADFLFYSANMFWNFAYTEIALKWISEIKSEYQTKQTKLLLIDIYQELEKYDKAAEMLNEMLNEDPYSVAYWNLLANTFFMDGRYHDAIEAADFSLAIQEEHNYSATITRANSFFYLKNYQEAHQIYQKYILEDKNCNELPYLFDGECLMIMGEYEEACNQLKKAEEEAMGFSPEETRIFRNLAFIYSKLGQPEQALEYLDKAHKSGPEEIDYEILYGRICMENGQAEKGLEHLELGYKQAANRSRAALAASVTILENDGYEEFALPYLYDILEYDEENSPKAYPFLALCYLQLKRNDEFLEFLKRACNENPIGTKEVLGDYFPENMNPSEYYVYVLGKDSTPPEDIMTD